MYIAKQFVEGGIKASMVALLRAHKTDYGGAISEVEVEATLQRSSWVSRAPYGRSSTASSRPC